ncbi:lytic transglycosylase domain-containing protein [Anianabacter salinae]|uniref:lytic transglycosylase domain-containing protein n=1 Tax=Anianabacter salinae TaxID=2851023 RepID=UPI00225E5DC4|nr:lytic transglycosylase domain-containing protein [Anianabacter salinae]MBV0913304.1 lytic transglycosylase domain-containing protein [Anianabacter salinae]
MRRALLGLTLAFSTLPTLSHTQAALDRGLQALSNGDVSQARRLAADDGPAALDIVDWTWLRDGNGDLADYVAFLEKNSHWPGLAWLRERGEARISDGDDPERVLAFFGGERPQTATGALRLIRAYNRLGRQGDADALAVLAWRTMSMDRAERLAFQQGFPDLLAPHHTARLDMLLWRGLLDQAEVILPLVPDDWKALAAARIALRADRPGVDALIEAVPESLALDGGLAYERFQWRASRGRIDDAVELMLERSVSAAALGQPARWARLRRDYARRLMREGDADTAYRLASRHFVDPAEDYLDFSDLEWLAGYLALTYLDAPEQALLHFTRFETSVESPISMGRAGYWIGRAQEALGDTQAAQDAYSWGGKYQTSFYGQLAAEKAGLPMDPTAANLPPFPGPSGTSFDGSDVIEAARLFHGSGRLSRAEQFLSHLAETVPDEELVAYIGHVRDVFDDPHLNVAVGKQVAQRGLPIPYAYFPEADLGVADLPVPRALALAIARRESEFDPVVVSPAGALGLMQLMPGTGELMARELDLPYVRGNLTADPVYNATLGSGYLRKLVDEFGFNIPLVAAGYNAGPGRPRRWIEEYGDPRAAGVDAVDWVEHVPFNETRNYIMRVMEAYTIYDARVAGETRPFLVSDLLKGQ